jgi:hypothetical protein
MRLNDVKFRDYTETLWIIKRNATVCVEDEDDSLCSAKV